ncbi:MAG: cyanophycin synthetase, partial [Minisyncoccia bacterium]
DPTVIVGSLLKSGTNFIGGKSDLFVVEACEYQRSFLNLSPEILVITNIDNDHLDYYGTMGEIQKAFAELVGKVPATGVIVCDPSDPLVAPVILKASARTVDYTKEALSVSLAVSGEHNIKNAKAALAVARVLEVEGKEGERLLAEFQGTWRRMEHKGTLPLGAEVYDDYAHHPTEINATLQGFRAKYPQGRIRVVFQPHLYSRTKLLLRDFSQSFKDADEVIVAPIYAARENPDPTISNDILVWEMAKHHPNPRLGNDFESITAMLHENISANDIIVTMGAGDIFKVGDRLLG